MVAERKRQAAENQREGSEKVAGGRTATDVWDTSISVMSRKRMSHIGIGLKLGCSPEGNSVELAVAAAASNTLRPPTRWSGSFTRSTDITSEGFTMNCNGARPNPVREAQKWP